MSNIVVVLMIYHWTHPSVTFQCDNLSVVQVVRARKTKDTLLAVCLRNEWSLMASQDIDLQIEHIGGMKNIWADCLSCIYSDCCLNPVILSSLKGNFHLPLFQPRWLLTFLHYFESGWALCF